MRRRASSATLVGRHAELAELRELLAEALDGRPTLVLLAGEAGVGKSRLVRELESAAAREGVLVLRGECVELGGEGLPYAPLAGALRGIPADAEAEAIAELPPDALGELALVLPRVAAGSDRAHVPGPFAQSRLHELLAGMLGRLAGDHGLLLVLEDLHWADRSSLEFLSFLHRAARDERLLVVATYRSEELRGEHPLRRLLGELVRDERAHPLLLEPLGRDEVMDQIAAILGETPDPAVADDVARRAEGNPFFVEELVAAHAAGRAQLTHGLRDALLMRTESLGEASREVVSSLAVLGRPARHNLLEEISGVGEPELSRALREAVGAHVLVHDSPAGELRFRHALLREVVEEDLLPGERATIHGSVARACERAGAEPAELALHFERGGEPERALEHAVAAAAAASRVYAFADACEHYDRVLRLADAVGVEQVGELDRATLLADAAEAARHAGDYERAVERCEQALALVDERTEPARAALLHERLGQYRFWDDEAALQSYATALTLLRDEQPVERARVLAAEGHALMGLLRFEEARDRCAEALALAQAAGADAEEGLARVTLGVALAFLGEHDAGEAEARTALAIAERSGRGEAIARAHLHLAEVLRVRGRVEEALAIMEEGQRTAARMGMTGSFGRFMHVNAAEDLLVLGRWDESAARLDEQVHMDLGPTGGLMHHATAAQLQAGRGEARGARRHLEHARELAADGVPAEFLPGISAAGAELALWDGRPDDAAEEIAAALAELEGQEDPLNTPMLFSLGAWAYADAAERARTLGDDAGAAAAEQAIVALAARLDELTRRYTGSSQPPEALAQRAFVTAELARARGASDPAAWAAAEIPTEPYPTARARWRQAEALLRAGGDRGLAGAVLREAHASAESLGAAPLATAAQELARRARLQLADRAPADAPSDESPADDVGLTRRELEVLQLVAEGLTNRQIADRLFISTRTAGVHVSHILAKLNAANRVEAAGAARRLGLLDADTLH